MTKQVTLQVVLNLETNPNAEADLSDLLAMINNDPTNGVSIDLRQETALIGLPEIEVFMATQLPTGTSPQRIRQLARQFYTKLPHWRKVLSLRLVCPFCQLERGACRCRKMGWYDSDYGGHSGYRDRDGQLATWLLDPQSVRQVTDLQISGIHAKTGEKLTALRAYLIAQQSA